MHTRLRTRDCSLTVAGRCSRVCRGRSHQPGTPGCSVCSSRTDAEPQASHPREERRRAEVRRRGAGPWEGCLCRCMRLTGCCWQLLWRHPPLWVRQRLWLARVAPCVGTLLVQVVFVERTWACSEPIVTNLHKRMRRGETPMGQGSKCAVHQAMQAAGCTQGHQPCNCDAVSCNEQRAADGERQAAGTGSEQAVPAGQLWRVARGSTPEAPGATRLAVCAMGRCGRGSEWVKVRGPQRG